MAEPTRLPVLRRTMNDVADGLLVDVREISLADLEFGDEESALSRALHRILASSSDCNFNSFNSSI
jgi:FXSXX-COOH protein